MRFKLDENLPQEAAQPLESAGHDVATVLSQTMGGWPDDRIALAVTREQRVLITLDLDFADIRAYPPNSLPGIIVIRTKDLDRRSLVSAVQNLILMLEQENPQGRLWIVDGQRLRIRG